MAKIVCPKCFQEWDYSHSQPGTVVCQDLVNKLGCGYAFNVLPVEQLTTITRRRFRFLPFFVTREQVISWSNLISERS